VNTSVKEPVDYIAFGPVFYTSTKKLNLSPHGLKTLKYIKNISKKPVIAIGGINLSNIEDVAGCGVDGVAIISALFETGDIKDIIKRMIEKWEKGKSKINPALLDF